MSDNVIPLRPSAASAADYNDAIFCERAVIGRMLLYPQTIPDAMFLLRPEDFVCDIRRASFAAMCSLLSDRAPIEIVSVGRKVREQCGAEPGSIYAELAASERDTSSPANLNYYAKGVIEHARQRKLKADALATAKTAGASSEELSAMLEKALADARKPDDARPEAIGAIIDRRYTALAEQAEGCTESAATMTGLHAFDGLIGGLRPGEFVVLGARPGAGKTACALQVAESVAQKGPVLFFSLEMSKHELATRTLSRMAQVPQTAIRDARIQSDSAWGALAGITRAYQGVELYVVDDARMTIAQLVATAELTAKTKPLKLIVIDYVQLIRTAGKFDSREQEVAHLSREMKSLARKLSTPVMTLAQLNREMEKKNRRPVLSDLRESGALEQDADAVVFIHRPYLTDTTVNPEVTEIIVAKNRHGETGATDVRFVLDKSLFEDV